MNKDTYYHFSGQEFSVDDRLVPQDDGFTTWPEAAALETILERYRPEDKLPRYRSVFLFQGPAKNNGGYGAASTEYCCVVATPNNPASERSDIRWFRDLDQGFTDVSVLEEDFTEDELRYLAEGYWSGEPMPGGDPVFEYRAPYADIKLCRGTDFFLRKWKQDQEYEHTI